MRILEAHGFIVDHTSGSHVVYYHPETTRRVVVPFHRRDIPRGTLLAILKQAALNKGDLD